MTVYGVDISNYQAGLTDFGAMVRGGFEFSFVLCSDGDWKQPHFRRQLDGCRGAGMLVAAYHYQRENVSASRQVQVIAEQVPPGVPVIIDVEDYSGRGEAGVNLARAIIAGLRGRGYVVPLVYIPRWYWAAPTDRDKGGLGYASLAGLPPLWISWYPDYVTRSKESGAAMLPASVWNGYGGLPVAVAQFTSSGRVPGYSAAVDQNVYRGSRHELAALLGGMEDDMPSAKEVVDELLNRPVKLWSGAEETLVNLLRGAHGYGQTLYDLYVPGGDPFGGLIFTDAPGTDQERVLRVRDVLHEMRMNIQASAVREAALADAVRALAEKVGGDLDVEAFMRRVDDTVRRAMADIVHVDVTVRSPEPAALAAIPPTPAEAATAGTREDVAARNEDGLRGGAAAPDGIGGPVPGDAVDDETKERS
ncbi:glycoside hydrolase family 25 protein [Actinosynnema sp. NPDC059335]|uniref:glycoside hydrolase family 25 protein n=1 Tax=Actinosynnema sp. NPDC059335 TaxID=3346804 RepID=UPI00366F3BBB